MLAAATRAKEARRDGWFVEDVDRTHCCGCRLR
jgi:hypothetical protein